MRKIAFVIEQLHGGGAERVTAALMNELCKEAEVHLISTYRHDTAKDYPTDARVIKHAFDTQHESRAKLLQNRISFLKRTIFAIDPLCVVSLAGCGTNALLTLAMFGKRIPLILSERNDPARFPTSRIERLLRFLSYCLCGGLVFQTHEAQSYFTDIITRKSIVIINPLTSDLPPRFEGVRERKIVNCCRLAPQKNLDLLIEAFADIAGEFQDISLEIYGEGPERVRLEKKILDMKLKNRIHLPGYSNDIFTKIQKATMFVSSSDYEGISNSMLEAMAIGVPTICTDCPAGGAREVIQNGENGILVPTRDKNAMAAAMRKLLKEPDLLKQMSKNGCKLREDICVTVIAEKWNNYIDQICSS